MRSNTCFNCGSKSFRADRALAGRLICSQCGLPVGSRTNKMKYSDHKLLPRLKPNSRIILCIIIIAIIIILLN